MKRTLTRQQLAEKLSLDPSTIKRYIAMGMPHAKAPRRGAPNLFNDTEVAAWMRDKKLTGDVGRPTGPLAGEKAKAQLRILLAKADLGEMERDKEKGELIERSAVESANVLKFTTIRNRLLGLPATVAPLLVGHDVPEIERQLDERIREALEGLSNEPQSQKESVPG